MAKIPFLSSEADEMEELNNFHCTLAYTFLVPDVKIATVYPNINTIYIVTVSLLSYHKI